MSGPELERGRLESCVEADVRERLTLLVELFSPHQEWGKQGRGLPSKRVLGLARRPRVQRAGAHRIDWDAPAVLIHARHEELRDGVV